MADPPTLLTRGGVRVSIGSPLTVQLPPRAFRGRLTGMLFDTDKTFLLPSAMEGIRGIKRFYDDHPGVKLLVVGHTDTVGTDRYNVLLSVERAKAIAAFLRDDIDGWLSRYQAGKPAGDAWGAVEDAHMVGALGFAGVRDFQTARGLTADGVAGRETRRALVRDYMAQDGTSLPSGTELQVHAQASIATTDGLDVPFFDYWVAYERNVTPQSAESGDAEIMNPNTGLAFNIANRTKRLVTPIALLAQGGGSFDSSYGSVTQAASRMNFLADVITHEMGHSLGVRHGLAFDASSSTYAKIGGTLLGAMTTFQIRGGAISVKRFGPVHRAVIARHFI